MQWARHRWPLPRKGNPCRHGAACAAAYHPSLCSRLRNHILAQWHEDVCRKLSETDCVGERDAGCRWRQAGRGGGQSHACLLWAPRHGTLDVGALA